EEGQADAPQPVVGAQLEGDELARVGRGGQADDGRVVGRGTQHTRGDVGDLHGRLAGSSGLTGRHTTTASGAGRVRSFADKVRLALETAAVGRLFTVGGF